MKQNLYVLYNKLSNQYSDIALYPTDAFAVRRTQEYIERAQQQNVSLHLDELEFCRIGSLETDTGIITPCDVVRVAWNDAPTPLEMEAK